MFPSTHYEHSGKAPLGGILLTLIGGLVAAAVLGAVYGFLIYWSPFVYINAFITLGFGFCLAVSVGGLAKVGKIRNSGVLTVIALVIAVTAYYVHWSVWVGRMTDAQVTAPGELWAFISTVNALGPWSIFGWTPTGFALWSIWGIEAIVIVGLGTVSAHGVIDVPFCEETGQWTTEKALPGHFAPLESPSVDSPSSLLQALQPSDDSSNAYTEVSVATAEGSELRCVSLNSVVVEKDKDGKEEKKKQSIVKNMLFDRDSFDRLMQLGEPSMSSP